MKKAGKHKSNDQFLEEDFDVKDTSRGAVISKSGIKLPVSIRLDGEIIDYFKDQAEKLGENGKYQSLINEALREYITGSNIQELLLSKKFVKSLGSALAAETKKKAKKSA